MIQPELPEVHETLDRRYDELESGAVKLVPGDEVEELFREKSAAARHRQSPRDVVT